MPLQQLPARDKGLVPHIQHFQVSCTLGGSLLGNDVNSVLGTLVTSSWYMQMCWRWSRLSAMSCASEV